MKDEAGNTTRRELRGRLDVYGLVLATSQLAGYDYQELLRRLARLSEGGAVGLDVSDLNGKVAQVTMEIRPDNKLWFSGRNPRNVYQELPCPTTFSGAVIPTTLVFRSDTPDQPVIEVPPPWCGECGRVMCEHRSSKI